MCNVTVEKTVPHPEDFQKGHLYKRRNKFTFSLSTQAQYPSSIWGILVFAPPPCHFLMIISSDKTSFSEQTCVFFPHCSPHIKEGLKHLSEIGWQSKGLYQIKVRSIFKKCKEQLAGKTVYWPSFFLTNFLACLFRLTQHLIHVRFQRHWLWFWFSLSQQQQQRKKKDSLQI